MLTDNKLECFTAVELIKMLSETDCLNCTNFDRNQFSKILRLNVYLQHQMVLLFEEDATSHLLIFVPSPSSGTFISEQHPNPRKCVCVLSLGVYGGGRG